MNLNLNFSVYYLFHENFREIDFTKKIYYFQVGGSCLEQTSWIRSSKAVKAELQIETEEDLDPNDASTRLSDLIDVNTETSSTTSGEGAPQKKSLTQYAVIFFKCQITFFCFYIP